MTRRAGGARGTVLLVISFGFLLVLAGVQLAGRLHRSGAPEIRPLLVEDRFPAEALGSNGAPLPEGCWQAFVVDPGCPACGEVAEAYSGADSFSGYWLVAGPDPDAWAFATRHRIPSTRILRLPGPSGLGALRDIGIFGVPTRIIVRSNGIVGDLRLARAPADSGLRAGACGSR